MLNPVIIDCRGHLLGRLSSIIAKQLLNGQPIVCVRTEEINISGSRTSHDGCRGCRATPPNRLRGARGLVDAVYAVCGAGWCGCRGSGSALAARCATACAARCAHRRLPTRRVPALCAPCSRLAPCADTL